MIKMECTKTYTMNFKVDISHDKDNIYELAKTYIELSEINKFDADVNHKIFEWLRINTRQFVPFKKIENIYPSFRIVKTKDNGYHFHIEWQLSKEINEYLF